MAATRRLTTIFAADVAGYSRLIEADEEGTIERLHAHRRELIDPKIREYGGLRSTTPARAPPRGTTPPRASAAPATPARPPPLHPAPAATARPRPPPRRPRPTPA